MVRIRTKPPETAVVIGETVVIKKRRTKKPEIKNLSRVRTRFINNDTPRKPYIRGITTGDKDLDKKILQTRIVRTIPPGMNKDAFKAYYFRWHIGDIPKRTRPTQNHWKETLEMAWREYRRAGKDGKKETPATKEERGKYRAKTFGKD